MPSVSEPQRRLFAAAEHGATFQKAKDLRQHMTMDQLHDFAVAPHARKQAIRHAVRQRLQGHNTFRMER